MVAKIKTLPVSILVLGFLTVFMGCEQKNKVIYTPRGYDITKPVVYKLGTKLDEISGICWINDTLIIANNDESGRIFNINLTRMDNLAYPNFKFGVKADYEDVVMADSVLYILVSTGKIIKISGSPNEDSVRAIEVGVWPDKESEFEALYYDKDVNSLIMVCKECHKEKNLVRSAYRFDLESQRFIDTPYYQISMDRVRLIRKDRDAIFRPSAAAVNPMDNKVYMVSPLGNLMVVTDKKGKVEQAFKISSLLFNQPEGITFAPNGDMYISNELGLEPTATLLKFKYTRPE